MIVGSDYTDVGSPAELGYNARIAANLGAPVLLVLSGRAGQGEQLGTASRPHARRAGPDRLARPRRAHARACRAAGRRRQSRRPRPLVEIVAAIQSVVDARTSPERPAPGSVAVWALPEDRFLVAPSVRDICARLDGDAPEGRLRAAHPRGARAWSSPACRWSMSCRGCVESALVVIPADRTEVLLADAARPPSGTFPSLSGIVLNGPFPLPDDIDRLIDGLGVTLPILSTDLDTYETALRGHVDAGAPRRGLPASLRHGAGAVRDPHRHRGARHARSASRRPPS